MLKGLLLSAIYKFSGVKVAEEIPVTYLIQFVFNKIICRLYALVRFRSTKVAYVSPNSKILCASKFKFGRNLMIARNCYIDAVSEDGIVCGDRVSFGMCTTMCASGSLSGLGKGIRIGNNVGLGTHGYYGGAGGVEIGDDTIFGNYVSVHPENHNYDKMNEPIRLQGVNHKGIKIGRNCWIGAKATILDGADVGEGSIVAAGAVVRGSFPPFSIIGGVPAKLIKMRKN